MSFGFGLGAGIGDVLSLGQACWEIYKKCKNSSEDFKNLSREVKSFYAVLKETEELQSKQKLSAAQDERLEVLKEGSHGVLQDLDALLVKYESLGTNSQRPWHRLGFGNQDITTLRLRLISQITLFNSFNNASSQARLEQKVNLLVTEIRAGNGEGSNSAAKIDHETWQEHRRALEDIGISSAILKDKGEFIITRFQEAIAAGGLEEINEDGSPEDDIYRNDSNSARHEEAQPLPMPNTLEQLTTNQSGLHQPTAQQAGRTLLEQISGKQSRLQLSYLPNILLRKDHQFMSAARTGDLTAVKKLLKKGVKVETKDILGWTALHWAAFEGHEALVLLLLEKGANVESRTNTGWIALHQAAWGRHKAVAQLLLENGADVKSKDDNGWTALHQAAWGGHEPLVQLLLEKEANVESRDNNGWTALHQAAWGGHEALVQLLLERGANVESKSSIGWTALHKATMGGHKAVVQQLLENGADVKSKDDNGWTALHHAVWGGGHEGVVQVLLEKGADVELKSKTGETALRLAAETGQETIGRLLLERGANPDEVRGTPLDFLHVRNARANLLQIR